MVKCAGQSHCISLLLILSTKFGTCIYHVIMIEQYACSRTRCRSCNIYVSAARLSFEPKSIVACYVSYSSYNSAYLNIQWTNSYCSHQYKEWKRDNLNSPFGH